MQHAAAPGFVALAILAFLAVSASARVASAQRIPRTEGLPTSVWAEQWEGAPIRLLAIAPYAALHDAHELTRRFPIETFVVATAATRDVGKFGIKGHYWPTLLKLPDRIFHEARGRGHG